MTEEEALKNLKALKTYMTAGNPIWDVSVIGNTFNVAIEVLENGTKKGKWKEKQDNDWAGGGAWVCSECGCGYAFGAYHEAFEFNYCPNCGAKMEE